MSLIKLVIVSISIIAIAAYISFVIHNKTLLEQNKKRNSFLEFINRGQIPSIKMLKVGLIFGIVFGFMDNVGLWFGLNTFEKYLPGGILTKSALGNTYSSLMGTIVGGFVATVAKDRYNYDEDDAPIWIDAVGVVIGCFLGLFVGRLLTKKS